MGQSESTSKSLHPHPHTPILKVGVSNLYYDESASRNYTNTMDPTNTNSIPKRRISIPGSNRSCEGGYYFKPNLELLLTTNNMIDAESSLRYVVPTTLKSKKKLTFILKPSNKQLDANKKVNNTKNVLTPAYIVEDEEEFNPEMQ